jgi:hypothetical protein
VCQNLVYKWFGFHWCLFYIGKKIVIYNFFATKKCCLQLKNIICNTFSILNNIFKLQKLIANDRFSFNVRTSMDVVCSKNLWMLKLEKLGVVERTLTKSSFKLTIKFFYCNIFGIPRGWNVLIHSSFFKLKMLLPSFLYKFFLLNKLLLFSDLLINLEIINT